MRNFRDESFIAQYLSPRLIRTFHLFAIADHEHEEDLKVDSIHNEQGYRRVRQLLAQQATTATPGCPTSRWCAMRSTATAASRCATARTATGR